MTCEEYLSQIEKLSRRIAYHREHILRLRSEADAVSCCWGESTGVRSADAPYVRMLERIEVLEEEEERENQLLLSLRKQAEEIISRLPDENMKWVLLYRFLEGKNYVQIADLLYVSRMTVTRWRNRALELLVLPEDAINIFSESC